MATTVFQVMYTPETLKCAKQLPSSSSLLRVSEALCVVGAAGLHASSPLPPPLVLSSPTSNLFEEALVEEMGATGKSLVLQTEEQVPEIDTCDALPCGSGAR